MRSAVNLASHLVQQAYQRLALPTSHIAFSRALAVAAPTARPVHPVPILKTQPVTLLQLHQFAEHPTPTALLVASAHLQQDLPARLQNLIHYVSNFGQSHPLTPGLTDASESTAAELSNLQRIWRENGMATATLSEMEDVEALTSALAAHRLRLEDSMTKVGHVFQRLAESPSWWEDLQDAATAAQLLNRCHHWAVGARLILAQHMAAWARHVGDPLLNAEHTNLVHPRCAVLQLLQNTAEDCRAFCVEKNSCAPEVVVEGDARIRAVTLDSHLQFIIVEVLKNALQAVLDRYGAWDVDEAEPILVQLSTSRQDARFFTIRIHDTGGGVPDKHLGKMMMYYGTSVTEPKNRAGYGYSRDHGSTFKGIGVGVPMSRVYAHFMGGEVTWCVDRAEGTTTVQLRLPKGGFVL